MACRNLDFRLLVGFAGNYFEFLLASVALAGKYFEDFLYLLLGFLDWVAESWNTTPNRDGATWASSSSTVLSRRTRIGH